MTALTATLAEAWSQMRVHKTRFVLSLLGVFVAVFAMTSAAAIGRMGQQMISEAFESMGGRSATLSVNLFPSSGTTPTPEQVSEQFDNLVERYQITWSSTVAYGEVSFRLPYGPMPAQTIQVDPAYGTIHRIKPTRGRWFVEADRDRLSPAVVVNQAFADQIGLTSLSEPMAITVSGRPQVTATIIGMVAGDPYSPQVYVIEPLGSTPAQYGPTMPSLEVWVPPEMASEATEVIKRDLQAFCPTCQADVWRVDGGQASSDLDGFLSTAVLWVGVLLLGIGTLGVINVAIVTVRQRIREIGVRRSFGATTGRVFSAVLLESALATSIAGAAAVATSIAVVSNLPIGEWVGEGFAISDPPPFPMTVAIQGAIAATAVGLIAGLIPALIAIRSNIIEAIRF